MAISLYNNCVKRPISKREKSNKGLVNTQRKCINSSFKAADFRYFYVKNYTFKLHSNFFTDSYDKVGDKAIYYFEIDTSLTCPCVC